MKKRMIGYFLTGRLIVIAIILVILFNSFGERISPLVAPPVARDGFTLVSTEFGRTGVAVTSGFLLMSPTNDLPMVLIDGQPTPNITQAEDYTFYITPTSLQSNDIYIVRLQMTLSTETLRSYSSKNA